ncbi:lipocalin family protein [Desertivirga arenae]|uniref:lipocalin family protein n=1 Tax=Desertivirga arenae TaxID=2810309 RepID=UPI001A973034|nr:lipocalin family protein [Pedobacter sp. SYSU D00823]
MNRIYSISIIILIGLASCNGLGAVDINIQTRNVEVSTKDIVGTWKMDKFSYKYLSNFKKDSIRICFKDDYTFEMNNSNKLFNREIDNERTMGTWQIVGQNDTKTVRLNFGKTNGQKTLDIYRKKNDYQLWNFLSDPDTGERIRFLK